MFSKGLGKTRIYFIFFENHIEVLSQDVHNFCSVNKIFMVTVSCSQQLISQVQLQNMNTGLSESGRGVSSCVFIFPEILGHNEKLLDKQQSIKSILLCSRTKEKKLLSTNQKKSPNKGWVFYRTGTNLLKASWP